MKTLLVTLVTSLAPTPESQIDRASLMDSLRDLPAHRTAQTTPDNQHVLADTEELLLERLRDMGLKPVEQPIEWTSGGVIHIPTEKGWKTVPDPEPKTWRNIYVEFTGREEPDEVIIVGAHFDTAAHTPGADDNATGTAAAIEMARVLRNYPMRRTVRIVFFNLEELGMIGSTEHAAWTWDRVKRGDESIVGMMSLEMIGYYTDDPNSQRSPIPPIPNVFEPPTVGDFLGVIATQPSAPFARELVRAMKEAEPDFPIHLVDFIPGAGEMMRDVRRSDHAPFWDRGFSAVLITDTSEFRNPHYHQPTDTWETLDQERFTLATRAIVGAVWRLAGPITEVEAMPND